MDSDSVQPPSDPPTIRNSRGRGVSPSDLASPADRLAKRAIDNGFILVDPVTGIVTRPNGARAERADRNAYGRVAVQYSPKLVWAQAHRIVWIAAHGLMPATLQINHCNGKRWDNRIANLELVSPSGNTNHAHGNEYVRIGLDETAVPPDWLAAPDSGAPLVLPARAYGGYGQLPLAWRLPRG